MSRIERLRKEINDERTLIEQLINEPKQLEGKEEPPVGFMGYEIFSMI